MNIIVTGASKGIGYELVKRFCENSENHILAISRNKEKLKKLKSDCLSINANSKIDITAFDLAQGNFRNLMDQHIQPVFDSVDILINNAGYLVNKNFENITDQDIDNSFDVNVKAVFKLVKNLLPILKKGSHIVNITSMGGVQGSVKFPGLSVYSASKGALAVLTESLAVELKEKGIHINSLALGAVQTEMLSEAFPGYEAPLSSRQMAEFISDFALTGHHYFNGKIIPVSLSTP